MILAILAEYVCGVSDLKVGWKYVNSNSCNPVVGLAGDDNMVVLYADVN